MSEKSEKLALKFFHDAVAVVEAYGETPQRIHVGPSVWDAVLKAKILDPADAWRPGRSLYRGARVIVQPDWPSHRVDVVTKEEITLLGLLDALKARALRDTGTPPVAYELGAAKYDRFLRAMRGVTTFYGGVPVKHVQKQSDHVGVRYHAPPPEWCVVNACVARKDNDAIWGKVVAINVPDFQVVLADLEHETERTLTFGELRVEWQRIPDRIVPLSRFSRVLGVGSVSDVDE